MIRSPMKDIATVIHDCNRNVEQTERPAINCRLTWVVFFSSRVHLSFFSIAAHLCCTGQGSHTYSGRLARHVGHAICKVARERMSIACPGEPMQVDDLTFSPTARSSDSLKVRWRHLRGADRRAAAGGRFRRSGGRHVRSGSAPRDSAPRRSGHGGPRRCRPIRGTVARRPRASGRRGSPRPRAARQWPAW